MNKVDFFMFGLAALTVTYRALSYEGKFARVKGILLIFIFVYFIYGLAYERILG